MIKQTFRLIVLSAAMLAAGCASTAANCGAGDDMDQAVRPSVEYTLGAGDNLRLTVFDEEQLSGEFVVNGQGQVSLPLIGDVLARGKTLSQFEEEVEAALSEGYLLDPRASVQILNYRPYYISGEVNAPGQYPYSEGLTIQNAVAIAGDFTYRANRCRVLIRRDESTTFERFVLTPDTLVQPGDTIRVPESIL